MTAVAASRTLLLALGLIALAAPVAAEAPIALVADALAARIAQALPGGDGARIAAAGTALDTACAPEAGRVPRLALLPGPPGATAQATCRARLPGASIEALPLGQLAIALAVPARDRVVGLEARDVFGAFAAVAPGGARPRAASWRDVRGDLPDTPPRLLAPAADSPEAALLAVTILEPGCSAALGPAAPFAAAARLAHCGQLRSDGAVHHRQDATLASLQDWARTAPAGAIAAVTLAELRALGGAALPLPLGGVVPTIEAITGGAYPAALPLTLAIVLPEGASAPARATLRDRLVDLLAESAIGPASRAAAAGLVPLRADARVGARLRLFNLIPPLT